VFDCRDDKKKYYGLLLRHMAEYCIKILHYCLMNNHVHLVILPELSTQLGKFMQKVNLTYMCYYRYKYGLVGHLWQGRYKSLIIDTERYLMQCGRYAELNPVRAGFVSYPDQYAFSSYNAYATNKKDPLVTFSPLYEELGGDAQTRQRRYINLVLDESIMNKQAISRKRILGPDDFVDKVKEKIKSITQDEAVVAL